MKELSEKVSVYAIPGIEFTPNFSADTIIEMVCKRFNLTKEELLSRDRHRHIVEARHVAVYMIRKKLRYSYEKIGDIFGRNHATMLNSVRKVADWLQYDKDFRERIKGLII